jgi:hypothetical protein
MRKVLFVVGVFGLPVVVNVSQNTASASVQDADPRLQRLQEFFAERDCPLREAAADFLAAADRNALDWRLLPSISIVESSGGKDYRNNNVFGWDSGRESFGSVEDGIHFVATQLANSRLYKDKDLDEKLNTYNPVPGYTRRVKAVMQTLGSLSSPQAPVLN